MNQSESIKDLAPALVAAQAEMPGIGKSGTNTYDKYKYANLEDYIKAARPILNKHGLAVLSSPEAIESLPERPTSKGGTEYPVRVTVKMRVVHTSGQWIETTVVGDGQDRSDKGVYKAITGARKYGMASMFGLATTDDPEGTDGNGHATDAAPPPARRETPQKAASPSDPFVAAVRTWVNGTGADLPAALKKVLASKGFKDKASVPADQWPALTNHVANLKDNFGEYAKFAASK